MTDTKDRSIINPGDNSTATEGTSKMVDVGRTIPLLPTTHSVEVATDAPETTGAMEGNNLLNASSNLMPEHHDVAHHHSGKLPGRKPPPSRKNSMKKRRGKRKSITKSKESHPSVAPTLTIRDDYPDRLVNPLIEWPQPVPRAQDLMSLMQLSFPVPDTFSIAYSARLLGFDVPVTAPPGTDTIAPQSPETWPLITDPSVFHVPPLGTFASTIWKKAVRTKISPALDDDDARLLEGDVDPLYLSLLTTTVDVRVLRPTSASHTYKLADKLPAQRIEEGWIFATSLAGSSLQDMQYCTLKEYNRKQQQALASDDTLQESKAENIMEEVILPPSKFGFVLHRAEKIVAVINYRFQWYPLASMNSSVPATSELILEIQQIQLGEKNLFEQGAAEELAEEDKVRILLLIAMVLEHARSTHVWFAVLPKTSDKVEQLLKTYFGIVRGSSHLVCDLHKSSFRYSLLLYQELQHESSLAIDVQVSHLTSKERWLVRLPTVEEVTVAADGSPNRLKRSPSRKQVPCFASATDTMRTLVVNIRAERNPEIRETLGITTGGLEPTIDQQVNLVTELPPLDILKTFPLPEIDHSANKEDDLILKELLSSQSKLKSIESLIEPQVRNLLSKVIEERREYEGLEAVQRRQEEKQIIIAHSNIRNRRKELDIAWQKQLEQDMDAVCHICNDGEVIPSNQILFCESCNVAVHQICYGVTRVPEGDYYCHACQYLERNKTSGDGPKLAAAPLPICCELCPLQQGAFIRTDTKPKPGEPADLKKWVHVVCAKWQGLHFVDPDALTLIEDVSELKHGYKRLDTKCCLCLGDRGAFNKCRIKDCPNWMHVTCARACGKCEVIHGEDCEGAIEENPWTLLCPTHSSISPTDVPKDAIPVQKLIEYAKQFPPEPPPPPEPIAPIPFNVATGDQRAKLLADKTYEKGLLVELTTKKLYGFRCEVCDTVEDEGKNLNRCVKCLGVICNSCILQVDRVDGPFKCPACMYGSQMNKIGMPFEEPACCICCQKGGLLRKASATPVNKKSYWKANQKEYAKTMFAKDLWVHFICAIWWNDVLSTPERTGVVNCSNVVMSNGRGLIKAKTTCFLCGNGGGLKMHCNVDGCQVSKEELKAPSFHITCARSAGLEVESSESPASPFYVRCYRHGGNVYNLRARLEDMIEIERRRAGPRFAKADMPMKFSHASRILNSAIIVIRMLGWAWRWAEWWVDYDSSWEPLLEPGQREESMTKEELKIIDSTRESRCQDARRCRLAALGAALRNRSYDTQQDFDRKALDQALRALLHTESLVGPWEDFEIKFFILWLGLAYKSKSRLLGLGSDKIPVNSKGFNVHSKDGSPKFELGMRPVPGNQKLEDGAIFEEKVEEPDDFLHSDPLPTPRREFRCVESTALNKRKKAMQTKSQSSSKEAPASTKRKRHEGSESAISMSDRVAALVPSAVKRNRGVSSSPTDEIPALPVFASPQEVVKWYDGQRRRGRPPRFVLEARNAILSQAGPVGNHAKHPPEQVREMSDAANTPTNRSPTASCHDDHASQLGPRAAQSRRGATLSSLETTMPFKLSEAGNTRGRASSSEEVGSNAPASNAPETTEGDHGITKAKLDEDMSKIPRLEQVACTIAVLDGETSHVTSSDGYRGELEGLNTCDDSTKDPFLCDAASTIVHSAEPVEDGIGDKKLGERSLESPPRKKLSRFSQKHSCKSANEDSLTAGKSNRNQASNHMNAVQSDHQEIEGEHTHHELNDSVALQVEEVKKRPTRSQRTAELGAPKRLILSDPSIGTRKMREKSTQAQTTDGSMGPLLGSSELQEKMSMSSHEDATLRRTTRSFGNKTVDDPIPSVAPELPMGIRRSTRRTSEDDIPIARLVPVLKGSSPLKKRKLRSSAPPPSVRPRMQTENSEPESEDMLSPSQRARRRGKEAAIRSWGEEDSVFDD